MTAPCVAQRVWPSPVVAVEPFVAGALLQIAERADGANVVETVSLEERDAGGVVAAVLQALEALEEERLALTRSDVSDYSAHEVVSLSKRERARRRPPSGSAELSFHERGDASTEVFGILRILRLCQDANDGLRARRPHEDAAPLAERLVETIDLGQHRARDARVRHADVPRDLRVTRHDGDGIAHGASAHGTAQEQRGREAVAGDVVPQPDEVARLLAAEHSSLPPQRLEHVAIADGSRHDLDAALGHQPMESEVRHDGDGDEVDAEVECEHGEDLIAVDRLASLVDREHAVAVAVEGDPEVERLRGHEPLQGSEVGRAAADVDVRAVGLRSDRVHLRAELREGTRREVRERAVRAVDADPEAGEIRAEVRDDMVEIRIRGVVEGLDRSAAGRRRVEERLDLLLLLVDELPSASEELHAVVLRRVVRRRDDDAEVVREQRDCRRREDAAENGGAARRRDAARDCLLELGPGAARVAADEHASAPRPQCRGLPDLLDEIRGQLVADDHRGHRRFRSSGGTMGDRCTF